VRGVINSQTYLTTFKVGELVDVHGNGAVQKGMPHKYYHGRTGVVWNVTKKAIGVELNKLLGNKIIKKRIHVRVEHASHSKCRDDFKARVKANNAAREASKAAFKAASEAAAKAGKPAPVYVKPVLKRTPQPPAPAMFLQKPVVNTLSPVIFELGRGLV